ncbi:hypothetical protein FGM00_12045 [Aggregatimonas sangjinii]|uniref:YdhG-like domain-containing protein n=1 Tax=Aggregatimonas sangjinii TaxID=2583587 RepID=A0A5B7SUG2_9FLAO|nr:YdeI/OmpD-associated family protein [Aggregatimonas sangjinii]QCX00803.1 hypothetical protein FGM00_12045 [Aggregatimonas sangjinii]
MEKSEKIERYYAEEHPFKPHIAILREIALKLNLEETYKWNFPTYMVNGKNVLAICKFNQHCGIWFFNGVFLSDSEKVLENAQEGKTQAMRHWKFKATDEINIKKVSAYMTEAIGNEQKGIKLAPKKKAPVTVVLPKELKEVFRQDKNFKKAFTTLSDYQQREYGEYIATAKQEKTKRSRLEKIIPMIMAGKGLNDKYK